MTPHALRARPKCLRCNHARDEGELDRRALDDFRADVDRRFGDVSDRLDRVESEIHELRSEMKTGFESINRTMIHGVIALSAAYIAGFAAIVTQL